MDLFFDRSKCVIKRWCCNSFLAWTMELIFVFSQEENGQKKRYIFYYFLFIYLFIYSFVSFSN